VGTYPSHNDFLKNKLVNNELKSILKGEYSSYLEFLDLAGCGAIELKEGILVSDNSQLYVGGYSSIILIDLANKKTYLFWLKSDVGEKDVQIYGERPIPTSIIKIIEDSMNSTWGHIASFKFSADSIQIKLKDQQ
jgi:hypothetical protein